MNVDLLSHFHAKELEVTENSNDNLFTVISEKTQSSMKVSTSFTKVVYLAQHKKYNTKIVLQISFQKPHN